MSTMKIDLEALELRHIIYKDQIFLFHISTVFLEHLNNILYYVLSISLKTIVTILKNSKNNLIIKEYLQMNQSNTEQYSF
jgi:hypothetical protein